MRIRTRRRLAVSALVAMLSMLAMAGSAQAAGPGTAAVPVAAVIQEEHDLAVDKPGDGPMSCNGGTQEATLVAMNDLPFNLVENGAFAPLPGAVVSFVTPANDSDQIMVTFSAEARVEGQPVTYTVPVDFLQVQILLDGIPMRPLNDLSFTTGAGESNATQTCHRLAAREAAAVHTVRVVWQLVDQGLGQILTGVIDDYLLKVEIND